MLEPQLQHDAPWKKRFRLPRILVQFALEMPTRALVGSNVTGVYELYSYDLQSDSLQQRTKRPSGTYYGTISPDGRHIYYMDDQMGDETGHIVRIPFEGGAEPEDLTPSLPPYTLVSPSIDGTSAHLGMVVPWPDGFDSYVIDLVDGIGEPRRIHRGKKASYGPVFSDDGSTTVVMSSDKFGGLDFELLSFDTRTGAELHELSHESSRIEAAAFSPIPRDDRLLANTNVSGSSRPILWDARSGELVELKTGKLEGEVYGVAWSPDAKQILLQQTHRAESKLWTLDLESSQVRPVSLPAGTVSTACFLDESSVIAAWQSSTSPTRIVVVDLAGRTPTKSHLVQSDVPNSVQWKSATTKSSDGVDVQLWYATPQGKGPFPLILDTHGGPTAAQFDVFSPRSQIWLDHGFAFASVNYRGSTTFGKDFEKKINGDLGHWEVEDIVAGRNWLVSSGVADKDRILLTGWSYGGYNTLQSMSLYPDLWAGGMGGVVVADWVTEYEDEPDAMRGYDLALMGGTPSEKPEAYRRASPINYLDKLSAPLLIIQGKNDVRCPPRQVELYEAKAKSLGKDVKVIWYDTGHAGSGADIELAISHHEKMLRWAHDVMTRSAPA